MNFILKILSVLFIMQQFSFSQWYPQASGTIYPLSSVYFINENTGFICGYNLVLKTTNAGLNWQNNYLQGNHRSITFANESTGFICSDSGKTFKTTNIGVSWNAVNTGILNNLMRINFSNENTGLIVGFNRTILKTTNSGIDWISMISNVDTLNFLGVKIINDNSYIVTGTSSSIYRSTDAGANWIASTMGAVNPLWAPEFINNNTGWVTGCCGMFLKTTNAGLSWSPEIYLTLGFTLYEMDFINSSTGYVTGDNGVIFRTTNGGLWWDSTVTNTYLSMYSIHMVNQNTGWVVGGYGTIFKTTNGGGQGYTIGISQISIETPVNFTLQQNYPNPFNPETRIQFSIPQLMEAPGGQSVRLIIYNALGRQIGTLVNQKLKAGTYEVTWNAAGYPSGVYYYSITSGNFSFTKKMVLIK